MPLTPVNSTPPAPQPFVSSHRSKGQRGYTAIKFLGALRGEGTLFSGRSRIPVTYQIDLYEGAAGRTGNGALEGPLGLKAAAGDQRRLRLEDGREVDVTLQETDAEGAVFETRGAISRPVAATARKRPV
ncbi:MAG TPA: hypothetical protein VF699_12415 [Caulobacteraceae bacterium]|jgi:hypothetical protein